jgi:hypothetical protein
MYFELLVVINFFLDVMPRDFIGKEEAEYFLLEDEGSLVLRNPGKAVPGLTEVRYRICHFYCLRKFKKIQYLVNQNFTN